MKNKCCDLTFPPSHSAVSYKTLNTHIHTHTGENATGSPTEKYLQIVLSLQAVHPQQKLLDSSVYNPWPRKCDSSHYRPQFFIAMQRQPCNWQKKNTYILSSKPGHNHVSLKVCLRWSWHKSLAMLKFCMFKVLSEDAVLINWRGIVILTVIN